MYLFVLVYLCLFVYLYFFVCLKVKGQGKAKGTGKEKGKGKRKSKDELRAIASSSSALRLLSLDVCDYDGYECYMLPTVLVAIIGLAFPRLRPTML